MFRGTSALVLDAKGRINVPVRHRDPLLKACEGQLTLTRHPDGFLLIYPRATWESVERELMALKTASDGWRRIFLGSAVDAEIDSASRVLIAPELRAAAGLDKEVLLIGTGRRLELWDKQRHDAVEAKVVAAGMTDEVLSLSL
ncbi:MAG: division/cell wall cluster transcriptional repressor MraZ [Rubrivivax sp.]